MNKRKSELLFVGFVLGIILIANLIFYFNYTKRVQTNYFQLPEDESDSFYGQPVVIIALEKEVESEDPYYLRLGIFRSNNSELTFNYLEFWKVNEDDGKVLYICNFTNHVNQPENYGEIIENEEYRFYLHFRSWFSNPFILNDKGFFEWKQ